MPFGQTGGTTITATMGMDTRPMQQSLNELPQHVRNALNQAKTQTTTFSEEFGKLFARGDVGERRFHGMISSVIRDLSTARGGAEGLASAMTSVFERMNVGGFAGGAVLVGIGVAMERLVSHGQELKQTTSAIEKQGLEMGRVLKLSTAADGFSTLAERARQFHKEERKAQDEANKDQEHYLRLLSRRALDVFTHPLSSKGQDERVNKESVKNRESAARAAEMVRKEDELALSALERGAQIAKAQLSGSQEEVAMLKLASEYEQRRAEVQVMTQRSGHTSEAMAALNAEFAARQRLIQVEAQAAERDFRAKMLQGELSRQRISDEGKLADIQISSLSAEEKAIAIARERSDLAVDRIESAKAEVRAAEEELEASKGISLEEQRRAELRLQNAQNAEAEARNAAKGAAAGVADERAKSIEEGAAERRMTPQEKHKQYEERVQEWQSTVQELAHRGMRGDLAEPPRYGEPKYDALRKFKAVAAQDELARQQQVEASAATPEGIQKRMEQQERENPLLARIKSDVSTIADLMQASARDPGSGAGRQPTGAPSGGPSGGGGGGGGSRAPSGAPPITPGQPAPQTGNNPYPWTPGQLPPRGANATDITGVRQDTVNSLGITPQGYANTDWAKVQDIQNNKDAFDKYWADRQASGADTPQQPEGEMRADKHGEWIPAGDYNPPATVAPGQSPFNPFPTPNTPSGGTGGGNTGGGDKSIVEAIKVAIQAVMDKYWR